jgi:hypothetical protein
MRHAHPPGFESPRLPLTASRGDARRPPAFLTPYRPDCLTQSWRQAKLARHHRLRGELP